MFWNPKNYKFSHYRLLKGDGTFHKRQLYISGEKNYAILCLFKHLLSLLFITLSETDIKR